MAESNEFLGTGRRKTAVARVRLATGSGKITVNGRAFENYFPTDTLRMQVVQPLAATGTQARFDIHINVQGGGPNGQAGAVRLTTIGALLEWQRDWKNKEHYNALMGLLKQQAGAYGIGVEYAYTMVHHAPQSAQKPQIVPKKAA